MMKRWLYALGVGITLAVGIETARLARERVGYVMEQPIQDGWAIIGSYPTESACLQGLADQKLAVQYLLENPEEAAPLGIDNSVEEATRVARYVCRPEF